MLGSDQIRIGTTFHTFPFSVVKGGNLGPEQIPFGCKQFRVIFELINSQKLGPPVMTRGFFSADSANNTDTIG